LTNVGRRREEEIRHFKASAFPREMARQKEYKIEKHI
jgi:hypothetical protein